MGAAALLTQGHLAPQATQPSQPPATQESPRRPEAGTNPSRLATPKTEPDGRRVVYANCLAAVAAGAAPIPEGAPGYSTWLDRDGDGSACE
ncbi:excalibur calcium-binding domain-containing protein [Plantactinospora sp. CA-294935]|uniref:excalibur calcium-binding domain-containing protein n=1 Tax=Plantactinospora sp. CA-294935 TaxID=3240012 RepID=UPI003D90C9FC